MADKAILIVDDVQDCCTSLSDLIWYLDYPGSGTYDGPAARELSPHYTSGLTLLDYRLPGTDGVDLYGWLKQVQPGRAGVRVTGFAAEATVRAATPANIRQVMPKPVDLGRPIPPLEKVAGGRDRPAQEWQGSPAVRTGALLGLLFTAPQGGGQPRGWLGVLVVEDKHRVRILVQLGLKREGQ
jgi:DNA-binding NtrC family response regulator